MTNIIFDVSEFSQSWETVINAIKKFLFYEKKVKVIIIEKDKDFSTFFKKKESETWKRIEFFSLKEEIIKQQEVDKNPSFLSLQKRRKPITLALKLLLQSKAEKISILSGCDTKDLVVETDIFLKRITRKFFFMPLLPTKNEKQKVVFLDAGINLENEPHDLVEFALVGKLYSEKILKLKNPKIALLNIGSEKEKGKQLQREAFELFKNNKEINFYGNIEPRDLFLGKVDVVVTDGYTGNICLKAMEGTGLIIINELKKIFNSNFFTKLCGFFLKKKIKKNLQKYDYRRTGGAILMGGDGNIIKIHPLCEEKILLSGLNLAKEVANSSFLNTVKNLNLRKQNEIIKKNYYRN